MDNNDNGRDNGRDNGNGCRRCNGLPLLDAHCQKCSCNFCKRPRVGHGSICAIRINTGTCKKY